MTREITLKFNALLKETDWNSINDNDNMDQISINISDTILSSASQSIPNKLVTIRPDDVPWMTSEVRRSIRRRNRIHRHAKHSNTVANWTEFRNIRNDTTALIRKTRTNYHDIIVSKMNSSSATATQWFKLAKKITNLSK